MAAPLLIIGKLFASKAGRTVARMALARSIRKMFKGTDVAGGIDIQSHTSAKVKAKGKPINMPTPLFDKEFWDKLGANLVKNTQQVMQTERKQAICLDKMVVMQTLKLLT